MTEKHLNIISFIILIVLIVGSVIFKAIPEYKEGLGSSDSFLTYSKYEDMVEFRINSNLNFAVVTNSNKVVHILIYTDKAMCLYNQNIEEQSISTAISQIATILIENNKLTDKSIVELTSYENISYKKVKNAFQTALTNNNLLNVTYHEKSSSLEEKADSLGITAASKENIITQLELYSKNVISAYDGEKTSSPNTKASITEEQSLEYANNVYQKLQNYVITNNIEEQDINSSALPISLIPASQDSSIYPSTSSWYYITNGKVYAYIAFETPNTIYDYCYQGTLEEKKKGEC